MTAVLSDVPARRHGDAAGRRRRRGRIHVRSAAVANGYTEGGDAFVDGGYLTGDYGSWDRTGA